MPALVETMDNTAYSSGNTTVRDAVNQVLEAVGEFPVSTCPTSATGSSIQSRALRVLERQNISVQGMMWPENTKYASDLTYDGAPLSAGLCLGIRAAGSDGHRSLVVREDSTTQKIWDADAGAFISSGNVQADVCTKIPFSDTSPQLRQAIVTAAAQEFQRRMQGSAQADQFLGQERMLADGMTPRNEPLKKNAPLRNAQSPFQAPPQQAQDG